MDRGKFLKSISPSLSAFTRIDNQSNPTFHTALHREELLQLHSVSFNLCLGLVLGPFYLQLSLSLRYEDAELRIHSYRELLKCRTEIVRIPFLAVHHTFTHFSSCWIDMTLGRKCFEEFTRFLPYNLVVYVNVLQHLPI